MVLKIAYDTILQFEKKIRILNYAIVVLIFLRLVCMDIRCVNRLDYG